MPPLQRDVSAGGDSCLTLLYQSGIWWLRSALKLHYGPQHLPTLVRDTPAEYARSDSRVWVLTGNDSHGRCHGFGIQEKHRLAYTAKYGLRKDFGWTLFFKSWVVLGVFFLPLLHSPPLLFIISVSLYTRPNLSVYTALIRSIPERFLCPGSGGPAPPTRAIPGCKSHSPLPKVMDNSQQKSTAIPGSLLMEEFPPAHQLHSRARTSLTDASPLLRSSTSSSHPIHT